MNIYQNLCIIFSDAPLNMCLVQLCDSPFSPVDPVQDDKLILEAPSSQPRARSKRQRRDAVNDLLELVVSM